MNYIKKAPSLLLLVAIAFILHSCGTGEPWTGQRPSVMAPVESHNDFIRLVTSAIEAENSMSSPELSFKRDDVKRTSSCIIIWTFNKSELKGFWRPQKVIHKGTLEAEYFPGTLSQISFNEEWIEFWKNGEKKAESGKYSYLFDVEAFYAELASFSPK